MPKDDSWIFRRFLSKVDCMRGGPNGRRCSSVPSYYCCWVCQFLDDCAPSWKKRKPLAKTDCTSCKRKNKHWCSGALKAWLKEKRK
jgi:hypothetical protein